MISLHDRILRVYADYEPKNLPSHTFCGDGNIFFWSLWRLVAGDHDVITFKVLLIAFVKTFWLKGKSVQSMYKISSKGSKSQKDLFKRPNVSRSIFFPHPGRFSRSFLHFNALGSHYVAYCILRIPSHYWGDLKNRLTIARGWPKSKINIQLSGVKASVRGVTLSAVAQNRTIFKNIW